MTRLDRHIASRYLLNILILLVIIAGFTIVVDVFMGLRRYSRAVEDMRPGADGLERVIVTAIAVVDLWGPRLLQMFNYVIGIVLVAALGFTCAQFVRHREFIAILASGVSLQRVAAPLVATAGLALGAAAVNQEFLLPRVAHLLPRAQDEAGEREIDSFRVPLLRDAEGRLFYAAGFDADEKRMEGVTIWERTEAGGVARRIHADAAVWDGSRWALENGRAEPGDDPGVVEPVAAVESDLTPTVVLVNQVRGYRDALSWSQIDRALEAGAGVDEQTRALFDRIRFGRIAMLAGYLLAVVIALPFFLVRSPTANMAMQVVKCAPLVSIALVGAVIGSQAPPAGLPVWLGVFSPVVVLAPIALWAVASIRT